MPRINISIVEPDRTLERSLDKIANVRRVGGAFRVSNGNRQIDGVLEVAQGAAENERPFQLDLIAHARDGELHLARWVISQSESASQQLVHGLAPGTLAAVRLLGCFTGQTRAGRAAMRHLKLQLKDRFGDGVKVYGTRNLIGARDFEDEGFKAAHEPLLIEHDQLPADDRETVGDEAAWFSDLEKVDVRDLTAERLQLEAEADARAQAAKYEAPSRWVVERCGPQHGTLEQVLGNRDGDPWADPGLLQLPDFELLFPAPQSNGAARWFRVTSLFGGSYLRVYPTDYPEGVLFRPQRPLAR